MPKLTASVLGADCPGIIATVSKLMKNTKCNIVNVSQTILSGEFASIFMVISPETLDAHALKKALENALIDAKLELFVDVRPSNNINWSNANYFQPFVVTVDGKDQVGLIADMSDILFKHQINIENMKAVLEDDIKKHALFLFEVMIPHDADLVELRKNLTEHAKALNVKISIQHRDIFEAIHRILPV